MHKHLEYFMQMRKVMYEYQGADNLTRVSPNIHTILMNSVKYVKQRDLSAICKGKFQ